ncbi:39s ribosomal protein [Lynx pardinus]|uniref:39s ribosomal protein n=1 Tax=Lynx pardinus TaxID=191816 RepID=A0A485N6G0_LYNPA|nr:39s ribosomal protein [Lynx pardinus]
MKGLSPSSDLLPLAFEENDTTLVRILRSIARRLPGRLQTVTNGVECLIYTDWMCHKFTKSRIADSVFQPSPADHEKYDGDPQHPRKLHIVTRVESTKRCPYWEKERRCLD